MPFKLPPGEHNCPDEFAKVVAPAVTQFMLDENTVASQSGTIKSNEFQRYEHETRVFAWYIARRLENRQFMSAYFSFNDNA